MSEKPWKDNVRRIRAIKAPRFRAVKLGQRNRGIKTDVESVVQRKDDYR